MPVQELTVGDAIDRVSFLVFGEGYQASTELQTEIRWALDHEVQHYLGSMGHQAMVKQGTINMENGTSEYSMPLDYRQLFQRTVRFTDSPYELLAELDMPERASAEYYWVATTSTRPRYYTLLGKSEYTGSQKIVFIPTPDDAYSVTFDYFAYAQNIRDAADTDIIDPRFPEHLHKLLIHAAALYLGHHMADSQRNLVLAEKIKMERSLKRTMLPAKGAPIEQRRYQAGHVGTDRFDRYGYPEVILGGTGYSP